MADTESTTKQNQQESTRNEDRSQFSFDSSFVEQMGGPAGASPSALGYDVTTQVIQSYFETIEAQNRQARRMADLWAQQLILQQTTSLVAQAVAPVVAKQVISYLRDNPQEIRNTTR